MKRLALLLLVLTFGSTASASNPGDPHASKVAEYLTLESQYAAAQSNPAFGSDRLKLVRMYLDGVRNALNVPAASYYPYDTNYLYLPTTNPPNPPQATTDPAHNFIERARFALGGPNPQLFRFFGLWDHWPPLFEYAP